MSQPLSTTPLAEKPAVGQPAPAIDATTAAGEPFSLAARSGKWTVVYFYPRANTPG